MSVMLRILLIVFSVITSIVVIHKIRKAKLRIDDAVFWVCFSLALIVMAVFPSIVYRLAELTKTQSPVNLLYLSIIFILIVKIFLMSLHISNIEEKLATLACDIAISKHDKDTK